MIDSQFSSDANGGYCRHDGEARPVQQNRTELFADVGARHCDTHAYWLILPYVVLLEAQGRADLGVHAAVYG